MCLPAILQWAPLTLPVFLSNSCILRPLLLLLSSPVVCFFDLSGMTQALFWQLLVTFSMTVAMRGKG